MNDLFTSIPNGWKRTRLRFCIQNAQNGAWGGDAGSDEKDVICVRVADFDWAKLAVNLEEPTIRSIKRDQFTKLALEPNDLLLKKSGGGEKTPAGRVVKFESDVDAISSNFVARLRPTKQVESAYLTYLLAGLYMSKFSHQFIKQNTGIQNLDDTALFATSVWIPDLATQKAIGDFLDRETARIDQLIAKKQRMVALIEEKQQELLDQLVTGYISSAKERKAVRVPWINTVPANWKALPIKRYSPCPSPTVLTRLLNSSMRAFPSFLLSPSRAAK